MSIKFISGLVLIFILFGIFSFPCFAVETAPRITDREIVERLTRLEEGQKAILREINQRFESIDKRFESIDDRFDQQQNLIIGILASFSALVIAIIGFALWDRMSFLSRSREQAKEVYQNLSEKDLKKVEYNSEQIQSMLNVLRKMSNQYPDVREALKQFNLL